MGDNTDTAMCANCGMEIEPGMAASSMEKDGETLYFCSDGCSTAFAGRAAGDTGHHAM